MKAKTYKTTINCNSCLKAVTPVLNSLPDIKSWEVDLENPDKLLSIVGDANSEVVVSGLGKIGFKAEPIE